MPLLYNVWRMGVGAGHGLQGPLYRYPGGLGAEWRPGLLRLTPPPTHIRKRFLGKKIKFIKGARNWRWILGTQTGGGGGGL